MSGVVQSHLARNDLIDIWGYIAEHNPRAADRFIDRLEGYFQKLAEFPGMAPPADHLGRSLRTFPVDNYIIIYRPAEQGIEIVRVFHGYRDLESFFGRRGD